MNHCFFSFSLLLVPYPFSLNILCFFSCFFLIYCIFHFVISIHSFIILFIILFYSIPPMLDIYSSYYTTLPLLLLLSLLPPSPPPLLLILSFYYSPPSPLICLCCARLIAVWLIILLLLVPCSHSHSEICYEWLDSQLVRYGSLSSSFISQLAWNDLGSCEWIAQYSTLQHSIVTTLIDSFALVWLSSLSLSFYSIHLFTLYIFILFSWLFSWFIFVLFSTQFIPCCYYYYYYITLSFILSFSLSCLSNNFSG
jgi:hypothetical protein